MDAEEENMAGLGWRSKQQAGFHAGKCSQLNCSSVSKFLFFSIMVLSLQLFAAIKLYIHAERFDPDTVASFILEGYVEIMNCSDTESIGGSLYQLPAPSTAPGSRLPSACCC